MEILKVENLVKTYGEGDNIVNAVDNISLSVNKGEFVAIVGASGSGKSTLLHLLGGVDRPTSGKIYIDGNEINNMNNDKLAIFRRRQIGIVYQFYNLIPILTVEENISLPCDLDGNRPDKERMDLILKSFGLFERKNHLPNELSGGQQRRVAFAGVLAMEPEVLVLDEPMAGLDPAARRDFLELIGRLHRDGLTVVMGSHSMDDLANCCDRIVVMNEGAVFAEGTPAQVFAHADELKSIGLGVPAAQRMALALAEAGVPLRFDGLYTVESLADELVDLLIGRSGGPSNVADIAKSKTVAREEGC